MATEIPTHDAELEELMAQLEAETGVVIAATPAPAPVVSPVAVAADPDDELLASLEVGEPLTTLTSTVGGIATTVASAADADAALLAELEGLNEASPEPVAVIEPVSASEPVAASAPVTAAVSPALSPDEELAALEAELNGEPTKPFKVEEERGVSFIPGAVLVDPEVETRKVGEALIANGAAIMGTTVSEPPTAKEAFKVDTMEGLTFYTDPAKFRADTSISDMDLDRCFMEQNSLRAFYGANAARSEAQHARLKVKFDVLESKLYEEERRVAVESGEKVTEKMLENRVKQNPLWLRTKLAVIDAGGVADINRQLVESLRDRKDMLVQMGADRRGEQQGQARMMAGIGMHANEQDRARLAAQQALQK